MSDPFDAYHKWLGIRPKDQPPHHYRLLGIDLFENDPDVIEQAADRQMTHLQTFKTSQHSGLSQKLLNEVTSAKLCLLDAKRRATYDLELKAKLALDKTTGAPPEPPLLRSAEASATPERGAPVTRAGNGAVPSDAAGAIPTTAAPVPRARRAARQPARSTVAAGMEPPRRASRTAARGTSRWWRPAVLFAAGIAGGTAILLVATDLLDRAPSDMAAPGGAPAAVAH
ncbi:MAG TPA: hypothetical protein VGX76_14490, partial [Pirellulales bacterium]|nr:hypothetical protein [Pirellulales bacterium]